ncbi:hypothetical protein OSTOST_17874 [Ostertagia ostertagi]
MILLLLLIFTASGVAITPLRHEDHVFPADDIIELPVGRFPDPDCEYTVFRDGRFGPKVNGKIRVGDVVFHSWKCSYGAHDSSMYCLMVNNCTVSSERDSSQKVAVARVLECIRVKLLLKLNGVCRRPTCRPLEELRGASARYRRHRPTLR